MVLYLYIEPFLVINIFQLNFMTDEELKNVALQYYPIFLEDNEETIFNQIKLIKAFVKGAKYMINKYENINEL